MRNLLALFFVGCGADDPSLTIDWTLVDSVGAVDCPTGASVDIIITPTSATFPCSDGMGIMTQVVDGQVRAELTLNGADGLSVSTASRLAVIDGPSEATVVFVLSD